MPTPTPTPTPQPKRPIAYLRMWNMVLSVNTPLELSMGGDAAARALVTAPPGNFSTPYEKINPGHYTFRLSRPSDPTAPPRTVDATLPDKGYYTVLVWQKPSGEIATEMVNETPDPEKPTNVLSIRQFSAGSKVVITAGGQHTGMLEFGDAQALADMPNGIVQVNMRALTPKGPRNWAADIDFKLSRHATVFVFSDPYGRVRFRLSTDGPALESVEKAGG